jgi:hypothetical protein
MTNGTELLASRRKRSDEECVVDFLADGSERLNCDERDEVNSISPGLNARTSFISREDVHDEEGDGHKEEGRIVGGVESDEHSAPWLCALHHNEQFFCGGCIIHPKYVLTASHCFYVWKNKRSVSSLQLSVV